MKQEEYRAQVDAVSFSPDFQDRTMARLRELAQEKEKKTMKNPHWRTGLVAAVAAAVLAVSAYAAVTLLVPQEPPEDKDGDVQHKDYTQNQIVILPSPVPSAQP